MRAPRTHTPGPPVMTVANPPHRALPEDHIPTAHLPSPVLRTSDLDYHLPPECIATRPAEPRDSARLMVLRREDPSYLAHHHVRDLPQFLHATDRLVVNSTRVLPARLEGYREDTKGRVEGLFLASPAPHHWRLLLQGKRMKPGIRIVLLDPKDQDSGYRLHLQSPDPEEAGGWLALVERAPVERPGASAPKIPPDLDILAAIGRTPLPPYIRKARERQGDASKDTFNDTDDRDRYQTVYAQPAEEASPRAQTTPIQGSVAAPTAGLHLTPALLETLRARGIVRHEVTLHVGTGTFRTVETEFVEQHPMHREWCSVSPHVLADLRTARAQGHRVLCVGTTAARTVESYCSSLHAQSAPWLETSILITPSYTWRCTTGMLTNFHLPQSTLMAMIASLLDHPRCPGLERLKHAYKTAIEHGYRFYSYGDAMLIL
jgi:S-adenosylmethionine:tRNA ribosyltransferase-isomerase